jgi:copper oxidase (laccase) domain-containing protein
VYDSRPHELHIAIGPSIQGCCYAINATIAQEVMRLGYTTALRYEGEKIFLDLYTIVHHQLRGLGVVHIDLTQYHCSACHHETYFSYRADQQRTGRMAGVISLQSSVPIA